MPRLGYVTGSRFKDMMTQGRGSKKWGKTSDKLAIRLAAERLGILDLDLDGYTSEAMEWGNEQEDLAIEVYERTTFTEVHGKQVFQQHPDFKFVGCTPDGLIGKDGMLEIKNPKTENHLFHILSGKQLGQYEDQVQGSLWVTGREYCDFVSHDSRVKDKKLTINITRVERNERYIAEIQERYKDFEEIVSEYMNQLQELAA